MHLAIKKNSLFVKTLSGLLLLSLILTLFLSFWMNQVMGSNYRINQAQTNLAALEQADESLGLLLETVGQNMEQSLWSNDFITYLVSPGRVSAEQSYRIIKQLEGNGQNGGLVNRAFLYSPYTEEIYDDKSIYSLETFEDSPVLEAFFSGQGTMIHRAGRQTETTLLYMEGKLFLIQKLTLSEDPLGILVNELDLGVLETTLAMDRMMVCDRFGTVLFGVEEAEEFPDAENSRYLTRTTMEQEAGTMTEGYYCHDSSVTGWTFLLPLDPKVLRVGVTELLPMYAAAAVVFLGVSILFDIYISRVIYRPVNRLMKLVTQSQGTSREQGDQGEVDFLTDVYSDAIGDKSRLAGIIENIAPEILDSMLKNLMVGKNLEEWRVAQILEGVGNPVSVHGRFLVTVCLFMERADQKTTDVELNLHLLSIRRIVKAFDSADCRVYDIHTEKMVAALVLGFGEQCPVVTIKRETRRLMELLGQLKGQIPYEIAMETSSIYQTIMDIRSGYKEAMDRIQYQQYMESSEEALGESGEEEGLISRRYLKERVRAITDHAYQGETETVKVLLDQTFSDLKGEKEEVRQELSIAFMDLMTDRAVALPLTAEEQEQLERAGTLGKATGTEGALAYGKTVTDLLRSYGRKASYRYVRAAKEYIEDHYANSSLSLNDVCEHIGISASYLSELFNEVGNEKFSGYLAQFRVEKACKLLRSTDISIKEIGFSCGFNSVQNFIRVFKKYVNMTPGKYREGTVSMDQ